MTQTTTVQLEITVGLDVGNTHTQLCVLDSAGEKLEEGKIKTSEAALRQRFSGRGQMLIVLEAGTHSPWMSRLLGGELGHKVLVANPRKVKLISQNDRKNDRNDAELLARAGRFDPKLLAPIEHRNEASQQALEALRARDQVVVVRTKLINHVRGVLKSLGVTVPSSGTGKFHEAVRHHIPVKMAPALDPLIEVIEQATTAVNRYDKLVDQLAESEYPESTRLTQVNGVGNLTGLAFMLSLGDPFRFQKSRDVGAYLGLQPRQDDSGESSPELPITKAGNGFLRRLLVGSAQYMLGPFGRDSDLRRWGLAKSEGGKNAKKRAVVGVARKLGVLLHHLWLSGDTYNPLHNTLKAEERAQRTVSIAEQPDVTATPAAIPSQREVPRSSPGGALEAPKVPQTPSKAPKSSKR